MRSLSDFFPHITLSDDQANAIVMLESFLRSSDHVLMLKGYAGSGKTTILKGLVEFLCYTERDHLLMAPTGRAAKVLHEKTGTKTSTVHSGIYDFSDLIQIEEEETYRYYFKVRNNTHHTNCVFIVDEASMISDVVNDGEFFRFGSGRLLTDFIKYCRIGAGTINSKVIFVGDPCQLPPVGDNSSKAFDMGYLHDKFNLRAVELEMREVKRQAGESGILESALKIRTSLTSGYFNDFDLKPNDRDRVTLEYIEFIDHWDRIDYSKIIIASKNKTCQYINTIVREKKYGKKNLPVQRGDVIIFGANNYSKGVFNGEFAVVLEVDADQIVRTVRLRGMEPVELVWRRMEFLIPEGENAERKVVRGMILENYLNGDNHLKPEESQALYVDFIMRHSNLKVNTEKFKETIRCDEFFNCLLIKYGYAVTCHKAQGGEWENVFTIWDHDNRKDFNFFTDEQVKQGKTNAAFYRWAYTAVTRATKKLYVINPPYFDSYSFLTFVDAPISDSLKTLSEGKAGSEKIEFNEKMESALAFCNLLNGPLPLQDHFLTVLNRVAAQQVDICKWEQKGYEIHYTFARGDETASIKTWINKDLRFNGRYAKSPLYTNSPKLQQLVEGLLTSMSEVTIVRPTEITNQVMDCDIEWDDKYPFTKFLYTKLQDAGRRIGITIESIDHMQYKERYEFKRAGKTAVLDFEYNSQGFWGRVVPVASKTTCAKLLTDLIKILKDLKSNINGSAGN